MKGLVVEIAGKYMVVADENGYFKKIKYEDGCTIGQEIDLLPASNLRYFPVMQRISAVAAVIVVAVGLGLYSYYSPYSYVSIDINPSVEIVLNRFEKVLDVQPLNEDGENIIKDSQEFMHKKVDDVLSKLIDEAHQQNYLKNDQENEVFITVSASKAQVAQEVSREVKEYAIAGLASSQVKANVSTESVTMEKRVLAKKDNISVGKFMLLEQLQKTSPNAGIEQVKDKSVKDIMENIKKDKEKDAGKDKGKDNNRDDDKKTDKNMDKGIEKEEKNGEQHLKREDKVEEKADKKIEKEDKSQKQDQKQNDKKIQGKENNRDKKSEDKNQEEKSKSNNQGAEKKQEVSEENSMLEQSKVQEDLYEKENKERNQDNDSDEDKNKKKDD